MVDVLRTAIRLKNSEIFNGGNWVTRILAYFKFRYQFLRAFSIRSVLTIEPEVHLLESHISSTDESSGHESHIAVS